MVEVRRTVRLPETVEGVEGEELQVPALVNWLIFCPDHRCYTNVTLEVEPLGRIHPQSRDKFLAAQRNYASMQLEDLGCSHEVPGLEWDE